MLPLNTHATPLGYQPGLDGLRGVFVLAVLFFHGGYSWAIGGYLGVSAFFTLSGFLICSLLLEERANTGRIDLVQFWVRRARRLLPAAWLALAVALAYGIALGSPAVLRNLQGDVVAALAYVANWRFIFTESSYEALFAEPSPVTHLWSLAIEEQYYLVFPLLVAGLLALAKGRRWVLGVSLVVLATASTAWMFVLHQPGVDTARVYYGTDTRAAEMLIGAAAAVVWRYWMVRPDPLLSRRIVAPMLQAAGILALAGVIYTWTIVPVTTGGLYRGGFALHAVAVVVVLFAVTQRGPLRALAAFEPLRRLGLISYGVYLFHWPIFLWLNTARTGWSGWQLFALRCAVTLAVSVASYLVLERPIRRGVRLRGRVGLVAAPIAVVALLGGVAAVPEARTTNLASLSFGNDIDELPGLDAQIDELSTGADAPPSVPRIAVFGDSTAIGLFYGLLDIDTTTGEVVVVPGRMRLGCGLVRADALRSHGQEYDITQTCSTWPEEWPVVLANSQPDMAVVLFGPWDASDHLFEGETEWNGLGDPVYDERATAEIRTALEVLTDSVDLVVWVTSPPIDQGRNQLVPPPPDPASDPARINRWNELVRSEVERYPADRATMVDLRGWFEALPDGPFDPVLRPDGVHIADEQAPIVGRWLADQLVALWEARRT